MACEVNFRPATEQDAGGIAAVHYDALARYSGFYRALYSTNLGDALNGLTKYALERGRSIFRVAVDDSTQQVVGFIRYDIRDPAQSEPEVRPPAWVPVVEPKEHLKDIWERFNCREDEQDAVYAQTSEGRKHAYVRHLMVDPKYQRRGLGRKLLQNLLDDADAEKLPIFLFASDESHSLYLQTGFVDVQSWIIDNEYWAAEIEKCGKDAGTLMNAGLGKRFQGVKELEAFMFRWPRDAQT